MKMNLYGGVTTADNFLYILFPASTADEDDRMIASGHVEGASVHLEKRAEVPDVVSLTALAGTLETLGQAAVMTGEGKVVFFSEGSLREEQIGGRRIQCGGCAQAWTDDRIEADGQEVTCSPSATAGKPISGSLTAGAI